MPQQTEPNDNKASPADTPLKSSKLDTQNKPEADPESEYSTSNKVSTKKVKEYGGQKGPEPTRYGDWEKNGRCSDF